MYAVFIALSLICSLKHYDFSSSPLISSTANAQFIMC